MNTCQVQQPLELERDGESCNLFQVVRKSWLPKRKGHLGQSVLSSEQNHTQSVNTIKWLDIFDTLKFGYIIRYLCDENFVQIWHTNWIMLVIIIPDSQLSVAVVTPPIKLIWNR